MSRKIYYLSTCSTCNRIINDLGISESDFTFQDIKTEKMTPEQVDQMAEMAGSYETLFSRRAMKYKSMGLNNKTLKEKDYRNLILEEYTFLKRPVFIIDDNIFVGNSAKTVEEVRKTL